MNFPRLATIELEAIRVNPPIKNLTLVDVGGCRHALLYDRKQSGGTAILLGKVTEHSSTMSLLGTNVWLDTSSAIVALIFGRRGSGKSDDLGIIGEGLSLQSTTISAGSQKQAMVIFDPLSQFWTLSEEPSEEVPGDSQQLKEISKWGLTKMGLGKVQVYIPKGAKKRQESFVEFSVDVSELNANDWCGLFQVDMYSEPRGQALELCLQKSHA